MKNLNLCIVVVALMMGLGCESPASPEPLVLPTPVPTQAKLVKAGPPGSEMRLDVYGGSKYSMGGKTTEDIAVVKTWLVASWKKTPKAALALYVEKDLRWVQVQPMIQMASDVGFSKVVFCARADEGEQK